MSYFSTIRTIPYLYEPVVRGYRRIAGLAGAALVPATLALQAAWAPARAIHLAGVPVVAFTLGVFVVTFGALRMNLRGESA